MLSRPQKLEDSILYLDEHEKQYDYMIDNYLFHPDQLKLERELASQITSDNDEELAITALYTLLSIYFEKYNLKHYIWLRVCRRLTNFPHKVWFYKYHSSILDSSIHIPYKIYLSNYNDMENKLCRKYNCGIFYILKYLREEKYQEINNFLDINPEVDLLRLFNDSDIVNKPSLILIDNDIATESIEGAVNRIKEHLKLIDKLIKCLLGAYDNNCKQFYYSLEEINKAKNIVNNFKTNNRTTDHMNLYDANEILNNNYDSDKYYSATQFVNFHKKLSNERQFCIIRLLELIPITFQYIELEIENNDELFTLFHDEILDNNNYRLISEFPKVDAKYMKSTNNEDKMVLFMSYFVQTVVKYSIDRYCEIVFQHFVDKYHLMKRDVFFFVPPLGEENDFKKTVSKSVKFMINRDGSHYNMDNFIRHCIDKGYVDITTYKRKINTDEQGIDKSILIVENGYHKQRDEIDENDPILNDPVLRRQMNKCHKKYAILIKNMLETGYLYLLKLNIFYEYGLCDYELLELTSTCVYFKSRIVQYDIKDQMRYKRNLVDFIISHNYGRKRMQSDGRLLGYINPELNIIEINKEGVVKEGISDTRKTKLFISYGNLLHYTRNIDSEVIIEGNREIFVNPQKIYSNKLSEYISKTMNIPFQLKSYQDAILDLDYYMLELYYPDLINEVNPLQISTLLSDTILGLHNKLSLHKEYKLKMLTGNEMSNGLTNDYNDKEFDIKDYDLINEGVNGNIRRSKSYKLIIHSEFANAKKVITMLLEKIDLNYNYNTLNTFFGDIIQLNYINIFQLCHKLLGNRLRDYIEINKEILFNVILNNNNYTFFKYFVMKMKLSITNKNKDRISSGDKKIIELAIRQNLL